MDHLNVAGDEKYILEPQIRSIKNKVLQCDKILNGYIAYLIKAKKLEKSNEI